MDSSSLPFPSLPHSIVFFLSPRHSFGHIVALALALLALGHDANVNVLCFFG
jgi:hypothetical protein